MSRVEDSPAVTVEDSSDTCGTDAGYQRHRRYGEDPCPDCRRARADYMRQLRARSPRLLERESRYNSARSRAYARLAKLYPDVYRALMDEELAR